MLRCHPGAAGKGDAVIQLHTGFEVAQGRRPRVSGDQGQVCLLDLVPGMRYEIGQSPVVGEQQEPEAVKIETAHRVDPN